MKRISRDYYTDPIYAGVSRVGKSISFNYNSDSNNHDILHIVQDTSGKVDSDDITYVYAYKYTDNATIDDEYALRTWLKHSIFNSNTPRYEQIYFNKFLNLGIERVEQYISFRQLDGIISIGEDSKLLQELFIRFTHYTDGFSIDSSLMKNMYDEIEFDDNLAKQAFYKSRRIFSPKQIEEIIAKTKKEFDLNKSKFILYKSQDDWDRIIQASLQKFHIMDYMPRDVRFGFKNFLKFGSDVDKQLYQEMQGGSYLLYDDFYTSGATVTDAVRYLKSVNETNDVIVFILIKQY